MYPSRLFIWGLAWGAVAVFVSFLIRIFLGGTYLPELAAQALFSLVPGSLESQAVETLGPLAKESAFVGASIIDVFLLAVIPVLLSRFKRTPAGRPRKVAVFTLLPYLVTLILALLFISLAQVSSNPAGTATILSSLLIPCAIFGLTMSSVRIGAVPKSAVNYPAERMKGGFSKKRRLFIKGAVGTAVAAVILYYGVGLLFSKQAPPQSNSTEGSAILSTQVTPNEDFYRVDVNVIAPSVDAGSWNLNLHGLVNTPMTLTYDQILALPSVEEYATLECVSNMIGGDLMSTALWKGVKLKDLLASAGVSSGANYVVFKCYDGYDVGIPLENAMADGTILAYQMNGVNLPEDHGYPLRAIVPGLYGMMNAKWITEIELVNGVYAGFWQRMGWENDAHYQTGSTIITPGGSPLRDKFGLPPSMTDITGAPIDVVGSAFAGDRGIQKVEVSTDGGKTWELASQQDPLSNYTWVFWRYEWNPPGNGSYELMVRATDGTGQVQTATMTNPFPNGATGYQAVDVTVSNPSS